MPPAGEALEPETVVEVDFHGWTHGDRVRQASFQGVRDDKAAKDVVREVTAMPATNTQAAVKKRSAPVRPRKASEAVGHRTWNR